MLSLRTLALTFGVTFVTACAGSSTTPRIRVARDLGCTADRTSVHRLTQERWRVTGCGRTAMYVCTYPVRDCWREGEVQTLAEATPPPP